MASVVGSEVNAGSRPLLVCIPQYSARSDHTTTQEVRRSNNSFVTVIRNDYRNTGLLVDYLLIFNCGYKVVCQQEITSLTGKTTFSSCFKSFEGTPNVATGVLDVCCPSDCLEARFCRVMAWFFEGGNGWDHITKTILNNMRAWRSSLCSAYNALDSLD
jgi:hypothetical protein